VPIRAVHIVGGEVWVADTATPRDEAWPTISAW
jgi:hypothetical protein